MLLGMFWWVLGEAKRSVRLQHSKQGRGSWEMKLEGWGVWHQGLVRLGRNHGFDSEWSGSHQRIWSRGCLGMTYILEGFLQLLVALAPWARRSVRRLLEQSRDEMVGFGSEWYWSRWSDIRFILREKYKGIRWLDEESRMTPEFRTWVTTRTKRSDNSLC